MKQLISADTVRQEHAAGRQRIEAVLPQTIVTAEARATAEKLGVVIEESVVPQVGAPAPAGSGARTPAAKPGSDDVAAIRAAILAKLPPGTVSDAVVDQLIRKAVDEQFAAPAASAAGQGGFTAQTIADGIKHVDAASVRFGRFEGAGAGSQVGLTDVVTSADSSPMAAGYMTWSKCFFPWTLNYDEIDVVLEGELHIRSAGSTVVGRPGDVIFIPRGSAIEFGTPSSVRFLYVTYPADWQG
ncbi:ethanolamine utilization acetate kinase EutQ [Pseudothauera rhizosphaerae]|uniref:Ethanolamine utilization acetate kinase EutQ n=1 Tax=Pseudothauera rhizosphaerae TaxID=2565932 RepID=A0A4S4AK65_9RHOO|nr:ethanolamine utilization acetate kinase EutQ [Pseudothauera rhizosphaerae]THF59303.1 ethanolamine utilization acetate kinase EutQ [Pseudothauera rhizosphaerae]